MPKVHLLSGNRVDQSCARIKSSIWTVCTVDAPLRMRLPFWSSKATFGEGDTAEIRVKMMPLRPDKYVGIVQVVFDVPCTEKGYAVPLPSAEYFGGIWADGRRERVAIEFLDRATATCNGEVSLTDGEHVYAVEIEPMRLPLNPTVLDWRIIDVALACCWTSEDAPFTESEVRQECYRSLKEAIRPENPEDANMMPDLTLLDCSAVINVWVPSLDAIAAYWAEVYPGERVPSPQKIANTLADFRMRFPRHF